MACPSAENSWRCATLSSLRLTLTSPRPLAIAPLDTRMTSMPCPRSHAIWSVSADMRVISSFPSSRVSTLLPTLTTILWCIFLCFYERDGTYGNNKDNVLSHFCFDIPHWVGTNGTNGTNILYGDRQAGTSPDAAIRHYFLLSLSLISTRLILPLMVFGNSFTNSMTRGYL